MKNWRAILLLMENDITKIFKVLFIIFHTLCRILMSTFRDSSTLCIFYVFDYGQAFD